MSLTWSEHMGRLFWRRPDWSMASYTHTQCVNFPSSRRAPFRLVTRKLAQAKPANLRPSTCSPAKLACQPSLDLTRNSNVHGPEAADWTNFSNAATRQAQGDPSQRSIPRSQVHQSLCETEGRALLGRCLERRTLAAQHDVCEPTRRWSLKPVLVPGRVAFAVQTAGIAAARGS